MTTRRFQTGRHFDYGPTKSNSFQGRMVKQELNRIKEMQSALHIPQLDELIHSAQQVLRPIYDLTARME
jgi:hypothetical protein